ncbi:hypothetical protein C4568_03535 [Candidatus Parcubacteria bacterium]|nr:MAG: hypothetical protein C4568_03535 [Candidatus Parcubacteria bacterium]
MRTDNVGTFLLVLYMKSYEAEVKRLTVSSVQSMVFLDFRTLEVPMRRTTRRREAYVSIAEQTRHSHVLELQHRATLIRSKGRHHGGFKVGAAGYVVCKHHHCICVGANYKPHAHRWPRHCAEEWIVKQARKADGVILGMVIVASKKIDDWSGLDLPVTISCGFCRTMFRKELSKPHGVVKPYTWLLFLNGETGERVPMTVAQLLRMTPHDREHTKMDAAA